LVITGAGEHAVTVDNIEVAQFIYLMLHNQKIRDVIDTITSKAVLILHRREIPTMTTMTRTKTTKRTKTSPTNRRSCANRTKTSRYDGEVRRGAHLLTGVRYA
jgi:hypothetical protein